MIGSLSEFEKAFGELWGQDIDDKDRTEEQREWLKKWLLVRSAILSNGNQQSRASMDEISQYTMTWDKHSIEFLVKKDNKD